MWLFRYTMKEKFIMKTLSDYFTSMNFTTVTDGNNEAYVKIKDVFSYLGYSDLKRLTSKYTNMCLKYNDIHNGSVDATNVNQKMHPATLFINQHNLNIVLMQLQIPAAVKFREEIANVLDSINKDGFYITDKADPVAVTDKLDELKATRKSIDLMRLKLIDLIVGMLEGEGYNAKQAGGIMANVTDFIYIAALLKTASYIKNEQLGKGHSLQTITTNQLRRKESIFRCDYKSAINYLDDDELKAVQDVYNELLTSFRRISKSKLRHPNAAKLKMILIAKLLGMIGEYDLDDINDKSHQLVHFRGLSDRLDAVINSDGMFIEDYELTHGIMVKLDI